MADVYPIFHVEYGTRWISKATAIVGAEYERRGHVLLEEAIKADERIDKRVRENHNLEILTSEDTGFLANKEGVIHLG